MDICSRYDNRANFKAPASIWLIPGETERRILESCVISISTYALAVIGNIHNLTMGSDSAKWTKIAIVLLLDVASLGVFALVLPETLIRTAVGVAWLPFYLLALCVTSGNIANALILPLYTAIFAFVQIPNALYTIVALTTSNETIEPVKKGSEFLNFITCTTSK